MVGYVDSDPSQQRPPRKLGWPLACLVVGLLSASLAYCLAQLRPRSQNVIFPEIPDEGFFIGYPLAGEAIYSSPGDIEQFQGARYLQGKVKFVIRNLHSERPMVIRFPAKAGYLLSAPNSFSTVDAKNWPEFATRSETIVLPSGQSHTFDGTYSAITRRDESWPGENWCFVFATDEEASDQGDLYNGCLAFTARLAENESVDP